MSSARHKLLEVKEYFSFFTDGLCYWFGKVLCRLAILVEIAYFVFIVYYCFSFFLIAFFSKCDIAIRRLLFCFFFAYMRIPLFCWFLVPFYIAFSNTLLLENFLSKLFLYSSVTLLSSAVRLQYLHVKHEKNTSNLFFL